MPILRQKQIGKIPPCKEVNQEVTIDFAGPFQNAIRARKYLLVSIDHYTGWPEAKFLRKPKTKKVIEFLQKYITRHGIPKTIRTDPATIFRSNKSKEFCKTWHIIHVECPLRDRRGNGKVERLIRTINELLRANKKMIITKDKIGLSEILSALRMNPSATKKLPYERYTGQEPNTIKRIITNTNQFFSEKPEFELTADDFESGQDSTIMIRERARGSKNEGAFKERKGTLLEHRNHTITFLPAGRLASKIISKRDRGRNPDDQPCCSKWPIRNTHARKQTKRKIE